MLEFRPLPAKERGEVKGESRQRSILINTLLAIVAIPPFLAALDFNRPGKSLEIINLKN
jgi:hypothetical protein